MSVQGIPESSPIDDGAPSQGGSAFRHPTRQETTPDHPLVAGHDEVRLAAPAARAVGILHAALLHAIADRLGVPRPAHGAVPPVDPMSRAGQISADVGAMVQAAMHRGHATPADAIVVGAREGTADALDVLGQLDRLDGPVAEAVESLLAAWSDQLEALVERLRETPRF